MPNLIKIDSAVAALRMREKRVWAWVFTGSIARSATQRYLSYSEADFEVFRPAGATCCTDGGAIWHGGTYTLIGATIRA